MTEVASSPKSQTPHSKTLPLAQSPLQTWTVTTTPMSSLRAYPAVVPSRSSTSMTGVASSPKRRTPLSKAFPKARSPLQTWTATTTPMSSSQGRTVLELPYQNCLRMTGAASSPQSRAPLSMVLNIAQSPLRMWTATTTKMSSLRGLTLYIPHFQSRNCSRMTGAASSPQSRAPLSMVLNIARSPLRMWTATTTKMSSLQGKTVQDFEFRNCTSMTGAASSLKSRAPILTAFTIARSPLRTWTATMTPMSSSQGETVYPIQSQNCTSMTETASSQKRQVSLSTAFFIARSPLRTWTATTTPMSSLRDETI